MAQHSDHTCDGPKATSRRSRRARAASITRGPMKKMVFNEILGFFFFCCFTPQLLCEYRWYIKPHFILCTITRLIISISPPRFRLIAFIFLSFFLQLYLMLCHCCSLLCPLCSSPWKTSVCMGNSIGSCACLLSFVDYLLSAHCDPLNFALLNTCNIIFQLVSQ